MASKNNSMKRLAVCPPFHKGNVDVSSSSNTITAHPLYATECEVVFEMNNVEVPRQWSQIATDILAQKYFRKAGVPQPMAL